jgi:hypothetical protein
MKIQSISRTQWHPFSITSSSSVDGDSLSVMVKCEGRWTSSLYELIQAEVDSDADQTNCIPVAIEGPYGPASMDFLRCRKWSYHIKTFYLIIYRSFSVVIEMLIGSLLPRYHVSLKEFSKISIIIYGLRVIWNGKELWKKRVYMRKREIKFSILMPNSHQTNVGCMYLCVCFNTVRSIGCTHTLF